MTVGRDELYAALRKVEPLLGDRLERRYLRLDAADGLAISVAGPGQLVTVRLGADVVESATVIIYGRFFIEFVRRVPSGYVALRSSGPELQAQSGGATIGLACYGAEVWPHVDHMTSGGVIWTADSLYQLGRILHAVSQDDARPLLQGVCFNEGWAAATDSYQLAAVELALPQDANVVIPGQALESVVRLAGDKDVLARFADRYVSFICSDVSLTTTLLIGEFPPWRRAVPDQQERSIRANRLELLGALERIAFLAQRDDHCALHIYAGNNGLRLEAKLPDIGHQEDDIGGENTVGDVCLQAHHLRRLLEQLTEDLVVLHMAGPLAPAVVHEQGYIGLLMPIRA